MKQRVPLSSKLPVNQEKSTKNIKPQNKAFLKETVDTRKMQMKK